MGNFKVLDQLLKKFVEDGLPGCACTVAKEGKILYEGYHGMANIEEKRMMNESTLFRLYSMTKLITCTAALKLYEQGQFLLNDPLYAYIPEFSKSKKVVHESNGDLSIERVSSPIQIKHLFSMTMGMPYEGGESYTGKAIQRVLEDLKKKQGGYDALELAKKLAEVPLAFEPGTHWRYGFGHDILAGLIEAVSGQKVSEYVQEQIFDPLSMRDTMYHFQDGSKERLAAYYFKEADGKLTAYGEKKDSIYEKDQKFEGGGSGLLSTLLDYTRFAQMLANGGTYQGQTIIGHKTIDLMRTNQLSDDQIKDFRNSYTEGYGYGLGVRTMMDIACGNSNTSIGEFGWTGMAGTYVSIDPSDKTSIVYMHQLEPNMESYYHLRVRAVANGCL